MHRTPKMLTTEEVARSLKVDEHIVLGVIEVGDLPAIEVGGHYLIHEQDFQRWCGPSNTSKKPALLIAFLALALLCGVSSTVAFELGQNESSRITNGVPRVLPFEGNYTLDGQPIDGITPMTFRLFEQDLGGTPAWSSSDRMVAVTDGRFAVALGDANDLTPIPEALFTSSSIYLEVVAEGNALSPRQRLAPAPQAVAAARAVSDFNVPDRLTVDGQSNLEDLNVRKSMTVSSDASVDGLLLARRRVVTANPSYRVAGNGRATSVMGTFCGDSPDTPGRIVYPLGSTSPVHVGRVAAKQICEDTCSSPTAHMCRAEEVSMSLELGMSPGVGSRWYSLLNYTTQDLGSGSTPRYIRNYECQGWTSVDEDQNEINYGPILDNQGQGWDRASWSGCVNARPILCCD